MFNQAPSEQRSLLEDSDCYETSETHNHVPPPSPHIAWRIGAAMYSFVVLGLYQSSVGVMLVPLSEHYSLSDLHVSLIFIVGPLGYVIAAQSSDFVHCTWGQRGIAVLAPALQILGALSIALHPPFGLVLVGFAAVALGGGFLDGSWCAWAANVGSANTATGLLQGAFSIGAAAGPFFAGTVLPAWNRPWYDWYFVLAAVSLVELCVLFLAFRQEDGPRYRQEHHGDLAATSGTFDRRAMFKHLATWLTSIYFLAYVGTETAISGWIVAFMIRHRDATPYLASMASSGFWGGMAVGRFALGVVTDKLGVGRATKAYFVIAIAFQVVFAFVHASVPSIIFMTLTGFVMGPMFASGVVALTRLLPAELHVAAVSFTASVGQVGGALLPFGIGAVIQGLGIGAFRYAIVVLSTLAFLSWIPVSLIRPAISSHCEEDYEEDDASEPLLR